MVLADEKTLWTHYGKKDDWFEAKGARIVENRTAAGLPIEKPAIEYGRDIIGALVKYMTAGPVIQMVWQGNQAVAVVTKLTGTTEPATSDVGTIRGDYTTDSYALSNIDDRAVRNLIHCSDKPEEAEREIALWFKENEMINYKIIQEQILHDINLDGILE
jgi:nucleoside-diphosphate kinase